ncbi:dihydrofolate reductase family protein [Mucilaginibacter celer]|uniref:Dihydrofolate reductase n=1 Tax=Mucilaginibacter celer TaxID=2305508 RepID=A0A494VQX0_9SPHI|nr:dihydrofolate reductase family protein [Mucilaginibacter celer]AYL95710.1 dihydrofolate reductase [Mucilaginibacter celer]
MRKLIVSVNITLDGFVADTGGGLDWHLQSWSNEQAYALAEILSRADTILLGRKTYQAMAAYWPWQAKNVNFPREDIAYAEMMNNHRKVVLSTTMQNASWHNSVLINSDVKRTLSNLKKQPGEDILTYGSISTVKKLAAFNLVDEYQLWVHPVSLGQGLPFFKTPKDDSGLKPVSSKIFESGVVLMVYRHI